MRVYDIVLKKRNGFELNKEEIDFLVNGFTKGEIPDYQMSAFTMAVYFQGMTPEETAHLTMAMVNSGEKVDLSPIEGIKVDKHSTGGVGDTTTLVLGPLVASVGVTVAKISGRGLGHTGGTLDKMESVPGLSVELSRDEFIQNVNRIKLSVTGQTAQLVPADKKLYALRDVTATVDSIPLIASSIMSKKIASGAEAIVLDVKTGTGAFMKSLEDSFLLAEAMVQIGSQVKRETVAVVSDMNQPLGNSIGNSLEVIEAMEVLKNQGSDHLKDICLTLGAHMVVLAKKANSIEEAKDLLNECLENGKALAKFKEFIEAQGGNPAVVDDYSILPQANIKVEYTAKNSGYIKEINAERIGLAAMVLGAGRENKESEIDLSAGLVLKQRLGDKVEKGQSIITLYTNNEGKVDDARKILDSAILIEEEKVSAPPLIYGIVTSKGVKKYS